MSKRTTYFKYLPYPILIYIYISKVCGASRVCKNLPNITSYLFPSGEEEKNRLSPGSVCQQTVPLNWYELGKTRQYRPISIQIAKTTLKANRKTKRQILIWFIVLRLLTRQGHVNVTSSVLGCKTWHDCTQRCNFVVDNGGCAGSAVMFVEPTFLCVRQVTQRLLLAVSLCF